MTTFNDLYFQIRLSNHSKKIKALLGFISESLDPKSPQAIEAYQVSFEDGSKLEKSDSVFC